MTTDTNETKPAPPKRGSKLGKFASAESQRRAAGNWMRADYVRSRGHYKYCVQAKRCDRFYLGGGLQWEPEDKIALAATNRKPTEDNQIKVMVNTAIGYQIANRMDIAVRPRGRGADDKLAATIGKVLKYIADDTHLHWRETEVFADGMIQQRGYFDIRLTFENNVFGEPYVDVLDPLDVMPDPDARSYEPETWADVTIDRWYTLDQIEQLFGKDARAAMKMFETPESYSMSGTGDGHHRNSFAGDDGVQSVSYYSELNSEECGLYHVVDRQYRMFEMSEVAIWPTGEIMPIAFATPEQKASYTEQGATITKRMVRRVKWIVSGRNVTLFDDVSPYPWFTVVPFFPYFRRGITRGMVDDAISPQEVLNKGLSQLSHILNTVANSGWVVEDNSIVGMTTEEFQRDSAKNGLIIYYKQGFTPPKKIEPGQVPTGILEVINQSRTSLISATGMDETLTSAGPMNEMSGVAYQARQYAAQQKLAVPLDNLARTRHGVARRFVDLVQMYMDTPRLLRITEQDQYGRDVSEELMVNQPVQDADGNIEYLNDLTVGEYDLVISEQPMQITFDNSQFEQVKSLQKDFGYPVPPHIALRYSSIADKSEVAEAIEGNSQQQPDPLAEAKALLLQAQAKKTEVEAINKRIEAIYGATQAGAQVATVPQVAAISDEILHSSGFIDQNESPIIPLPEAGVDPQVGAGLADVAPDAPLIEPGADLNGPAPTNTNPLTPANPATGVNEGIKEPGVQ